MDDSGLHRLGARLVRADLGSDPANKAKVMEKAEEQFILAQDDYELAKMAIILGRIFDRNSWKKVTFKLSQ